MMGRGFLLMIKKVRKTWSTFPQLLVNKMKIVPLSINNQTSTIKHSSISIHLKTIPNSLHRLDKFITNLLSDLSNVHIDCSAVLS